MRPASGSAPERSLPEGRLPVNRVEPKPLTWIPYKYGVQLPDEKGKHRGRVTYKTPHRTKRETVFSLRAYTSA